MKLAAATAVSLMMLAAPAFAAPTTANTTCAVGQLTPAQQAVVNAELAAQNGGTVPDTIPGNFGGLNQLVKSDPLAQAAGVKNAAQLAKAVGYSPSQINEA